ncbi:hypothetical protein OIU84_001863 [Salix udensis]|uniref:DUF4283 domain-containing protein n=1 Tax=Salix udensis TaxID=889485 RepID=A0AAD6K7T0_9ROSI|nr:hypothetical protein OIU84_001863 [Salix udensis]
MITLVVSTELMMNDIVFVVGASDLSSNGAITGGEREQTHEVRDIGGAASPPPSPPPISMSFKDKFSADFGMAEDIMVIGDEDFIIQNGKVPSIQFSDKIKDCLYRPWKSAIIIKLMGRLLTYNFLREQLLRRWKLKEPITLIDLENNFLIVKFLLDEDMKYVLIGGPWQVVGQYVTT